MTQMPLPQPAPVLDMTAELAQSLVSAAKMEASERGVRLAFVVVDRAGNPVCALRDDGAQLGAPSLAADKAYTAAAFGMPTGAWTDNSAPGGSDWGLAGTLTGRAIVFPGGVPLYAQGQLIGALGVSGAASVVDEQCALTAAATVGLAVSA